MNALSLIIQSPPLLIVPILALSLAGFLIYTKERYVVHGIGPFSRRLASGRAIPDAPHEGGEESQATRETLKPDSSSRGETAYATGENSLSIAVAHAEKDDEDTPDVVAPDQVSLHHVEQVVGEIDRLVTHLLALRTDLRTARGNESSATTGQSDALSTHGDTRHRVAEPHRANAPEQPKVQQTTASEGANAPIVSGRMREEDLKPMLESAGLVWVNTDIEKLREAQRRAEEASRSGPDVEQVKRALKRFRENERALERHREIAFERQRDSEKDEESRRH